MMTRASLLLFLALIPVIYSSQPLKQCPVFYPNAKFEEQIEIAVKNQYLNNETFHGNFSLSIDDNPLLSRVGLVGLIPRSMDIIRYAYYVWVDKGNHLMSDPTLLTVRKELQKSLEDFMSNDPMSIVTDDDIIRLCSCIESGMFLENHKVLIPKLTEMCYHGAESMCMHREAHTRNVQDFKKKVDFFMQIFDTVSIVKPGEKTSASEKVLNEISITAFNIMQMFKNIHVSRENAIYSLRGLQMVSKICSSKASNLKPELRKTIASWKGDDHGDYPDKQKCSPRVQEYLQSRQVG